MRQHRPRGINANLLEVNDDKTVALVQASRNNQNKHNSTMRKIDDCDVIPSPSVYNIGIAFDAEMAIVCQVQHIYCTPCYHLRNIASTRSCLTEKAAVKIINPLVIGRLDHVNAPVRHSWLPYHQTTKSATLSSSTGSPLQYTRAYHPGANEA